MFLQSSYEALRAVVQTRSFTKAGEVLGISSAAVGKHIKVLEARLNLRLFHRTTRTVTPTEAALKLADALHHSQDYLTQTLDQLADAQTAPTGKLRVNVPMSYGEQFLAPAIARYAALYPDVIVDVDFDDKRVHLIEEGYDVIVRIGALEDSGLIAKRISDFPILLCASPDFIASHGMPEMPAHMAHFPMICYSNAPTPSLWHYRTPEGQAQSLSLSPALYANSATMMKEACLAGVGVALLPYFSCQTEIADGRLVSLLPDYHVTPERAVYVIYPERHFLPQKVRLFIDVLSEDAYHKNEL